MLSFPHPRRPRRPRIRGTVVLVLGLASLVGCEAAFTASPPAVVTAPPVVVETPTVPLPTVPSPSASSTPFDSEGTGLRIPILLYHRVAEPSTKYPGLFVSPAAFEAQMSAIAASKVATLTMEDLISAVRLGRTFPHGAIAVTFDDASEDQYATAFPILRRYRIRSSLFVPTQRIGRSGNLTWPQLQEMVASGLVAVESHTVDHVDLTKLTDDKAKREIDLSRAILRERLHVPVSAFAYPFGRFSTRIEKLVTEAGYSCAVTTGWRWTHSLVDELTWGRMEVHNLFPGAYLAALARLSGTWANAPAHTQQPVVRRRSPSPTPSPTPTVHHNPTPSPTPKPTGTKTP